uniref:MULE transposase domain-containing protein n=1 Tax=Globodera rostochiensis TaxID=31243 RepID=A0A914HQ55_GLORO
MGRSCRAYSVGEVIDHGCFVNRRENAEEITAPPLFHQILVIMAKRENWGFPVCYCLLSCKTATTYDRTFQMMKAVWPNFAPEIVTVDFEEALINAIRSVFGHVQIDGCFFLLVHNFHRRLNGFDDEYGNNLLQTYRSDPIFAESARMITSLAIDLTAAIVALEQVLPDSLEPVFMWFMTYYTGRPLLNGGRTQPQFLPDLWNLYTRTLDGRDKTKNHAESSHRRLKRAFSCTHPSIWHFINVLRTEQKSRDADFARFPFTCVSVSDLPFLAYIPPEEVRRMALMKTCSTNFVSRTCRFEVAGHSPPPYNWLSVRQLDL